MSSHGREEPTSGTTRLTPGRLHGHGAAWGAALLLGAVGVFASWVGLLDLLSAADLQYKLIGLAFAVAGLILLTGTAVLLRTQWRWKRGRIATVAAGVTGGLVGGYLLLMQYWAPGLSPSRVPPFPAWLPWAGIVVVSVAGTILGWKSTTGHADEQVPWTALGGRLITGGLSLTVLFGGVQWWYTQQYQPGTIAAALTVTTELRPAAASTTASRQGTSDPDLFEGTIQVRNVSDTKVQIVASQYQVTKVSYGSRGVVKGINGVDTDRQTATCFLEDLAPVTDPECDEPGIFEYGEFSAGDPLTQDDAPISRTTQAEAFQVLQLGHISSEGAWLEPKEEFELNVLVHVPPEEQLDPNEPRFLETLELSATLAVAKGSRLILDRVPVHGPEMVTQAVMSNEEYRQYKKAEEAVELDGQQVGESSDHTATKADRTEEVDVGRRQAYYEELSMPKTSDDTILEMTELETSPRNYPHRYIVTEWRIADLSTLHRLVSGSQVVNSVEVLSSRSFDPLGAVYGLPALTWFESPEMVACISPAGRFENQDNGQDMRRDPTAVCPGIWYTLDEGGDMNNYERQYQEAVGYREDMEDFYGLVLTGAADVIPLTAAAEDSTLPVAASPPLYHPIPSPVFVTCKPAFESAASLSTDYVAPMQAAFGRYAAETRGSGGAQGTAAAALDEAATASYLVDALLDPAIDTLKDCSTEEAPEETPAASCTAAAAAEISALRYARDLGAAVREHQAVMQQVADGVMSAREASAMAQASLERGAAASSAYNATEAQVGGLLETCR